MTNEAGILLESGTNELEIIEFEVNNNKFGINVLKVREIIQPVPLTPIPHAHPNVLGIIQLRGEVLPVISMEKALNMYPTNEESKENEKFIVAEFNQQKVVFQVHHVTQIHRISWEQIEKPSNLYSVDSSHIIGVIKRETEMLLLIDFEKIVVDINPEAGIHVAKIKSLGVRERSLKRIIAAEDSPLLRKLIHETLHAAGYEQVEFFENGQDALDYLQAISKSGKNVYDEVQLVITDIEMPQMDGHHFAKRIQENEKLSKLPVIIFSSLITDDLRHKGETVGAVEQVSKPEINELVLKIDQHIL
ncbi:chemotaxis protein [Lederbergia lenta]|uniref:Chemotaxis protein CheV n=1 Tax=Lederbergia lenta TaxID=1467 RepID=A0A2X4W8P4_LEDLE|nr:chemotaxis protein [Lederbergia lenta]MCM3110321.1 chemotaxis protein [Lederbergia lenta]MEC2324111.1 chemotaxis protein [Lederbergia lenta]SQI60586.1 chemotaxis protein CheV [Lederbergia lenta]